MRRSEEVTDMARSARMEDLHGIRSLTTNTDDDGMKKVRNDHGDRNGRKRKERTLDAKHGRGRSSTSRGSRVSEVVSWKRLGVTVSLAGDVWVVGKIEVGAGEKHRQMLIQNGWTARMMLLHLDELRPIYSDGCRSAKRRSSALSHLRSKQLRQRLCWLIRAQKAICLSSSTLKRMTRWTSSLLD